MIIFFIFQCTIWRNQLSYESIKNYLGDFVTSPFPQSTHKHILSSQKNHDSVKPFCSQHTEIFTTWQKKLSTHHLLPGLKLIYQLHSNQEVIEFQLLIRFISQVITKVEIRPSSTNAYYKRTCLIEFRQRVVFHCYHSTFRSI